MNNNNEKAIALAGKLIVRGTRLSQWIKEQIEFDSKHKIKRDYKKDFDLLDEIIAKTKKLHNIIKQNSPGYSFARESSFEIAGVSVNEAKIYMSETNSIIPTKIPEDRNELHKMILAVQKKENVSYDEALNICRYGKK